MVKTVTKGIFQSDIIIRTAIMQALRELREQPWLLDFVFAGLVHDELTAQTYGELEIEKAKDWFLNSEVVVSMAYRVDRPQLPCIAIELLESNEGGPNSLGDVSAEGPTEQIDASDIFVKPAPVLGPFTPKSYDSKTGFVALPTSLTTSSVFEGNVLYDAVSNTGYPILSVEDGGFFIRPGVRANFTRAFVAPRDNLHVVALESVGFQETYRVSCVVNTALVHLNYLHSILTFILLRSKQELLEARGFENTTVRSGGIKMPEGASETEVLWSRDTTISGFVRQYWPKSVLPKIDGLIVEPIKVIGGGKSPDGIAQSVADQGWEMEEDQFSALRR